MAARCAWKAVWAKGDVRYTNDGRREVRNARGEASAYHAFAQQGTGLLGSIQGPGCAACGGTDSNNQFDPVTNDLLRRSEHGTTTEYGHYDAFGHPGYVIEAAGTAEARRTEYVYDPRFRGKPQLVRTTSVYPGGERIETFRYDDQGRTLERTLRGYDPDGQAITRSYRFEYQGPFGQLSRGYPGG